MVIEQDEFIIDVLELLDSAEADLLVFDQLPENQSSTSHYDAVFRAYHNIKGGAAMMDMEALQHHVHQLENLLMQSEETSSIPQKWGTSIY